MRTITEIQNDHHISSIKFDTEKRVGSAVIKFVRWQGTVLFGYDESGWQHVSVSPFKKSILPNWYEMCEVKDIFWRDYEEVIQFFPKKSEYVNVNKNCLHLWRNPKLDDKEWFR